MGQNLRDLTFDMSGGAKGAKRPLVRPLDGGAVPILDCELDRASRDSAARDHEFGHRDGKFEATRPRTAGIDEQDAVALFHGGLVRVPGYYDLNSRIAWFDV